MKVPYEVPDDPGVPGAWPSFGSWPDTVSANRETAESWDFQVAGTHVRELRELARREVIERGYRWSQDAGIEVRRPRDATQPIVMTGHQPELYHCGVWVKQFAMQRLADEIGASAVNIVVDSDAFDDVSFVLPCPHKAARCRYEVARGGRDVCFACAPPPDAETLREVFARAERDAEGLGGGISAGIAAFGGALGRTADSSQSLAEALTKARRIHESAAGTYMELPISNLAAGGAFLTFAAEMIANAEGFVDAYNSELSGYRAERRIRSIAQPFPNLRRDASTVELPLWVLGEGRRPLSVKLSGERRLLLAGDETLVDLTACGDIIDSLRCSGISLAPKALALTMFTRAFCSDVLIHGLGGARYDEVTDRVFRRYFGVEPPDFVTITLTMRLPLDASVVTEEEVSGLRARINRLEHNPDEFLTDVELFEPGRQRALKLVAEKGDLVRHISEPDADKKALGSRIREVNAALSELVGPVRRALEEELERAEREREGADVLTSRDYPFFLWSPSDIAASIK